MRIYVDFDDVITETASHLALLAHEMFGTDVAYDDIVAFNLEVSFALDRDQLERLMARAHSREAVLNYRETPGASDSIRKWISSGHDVEVVTGRPYHTAKDTWEWLANHGLGDVRIIHVDKFGRESPSDAPEGRRSLTVDEFCRRRYDFAVEDSPAALVHLERIQPCRVAVFARPWNRTTAMPSPAFRRCAGWNEIMAYAAEQGTH